MSKSEQPDPEREELVAYLDGELSHAESESVELQMRADQEVRAQLQQYDRVWNALDHLPRATVDDNFARTTIEMATVEARKDIASQTAMLPIRKRNYRLKLMGMAVAATVLGFMALSTILPSENRTLYTNLPVVSQLEAYSEVRDIEFLRKLQQECGDWLIADYGQAVEADAQELAALTTASYRERRSHVQQLAEDERADLADKARRYAGLSPPMRDELNARHAAIAAAPDADELRATMLAHQAWALELREGEQAELRQLDTDARVARIAESQARMKARGEKHLSKGELVALRQVFRTAVDDPEILALRQELIKVLPKVQGIEPGMPREARIKRWVVMQFARSRPHESIGLALMASAGKHDAIRLPELSAYVDAVESKLQVALDESTLEYINTLEQSDRRKRLANWLHDSQKRKRPDTATLEEYFVSGSLPPDVQQKLLAMPKEEMLRSLEERYRQEMMGDTDQGNRNGREFDRRGSDPPRSGRGGELGDRDDRRREGRGPGGPRGDRPLPPGA